MADKPKTISKEAAKLLGVPFQWPNSHVLRYKRTNDGIHAERFYEGQWEWIGPESGLDPWFKDKGAPEIREEFDDRKEFKDECDPTAW